MASFAACGVFFLKFWRASRDRFFLLFCLACFLLAAERVALLFVDGGYASIPTAVNEARSFVYIFRLCAFALILLAVIEKNRNNSRY
jgi:hypothetical protein